MNLVRRVYSHPRYKDCSYGAYILFYLSFDGTWKEDAPDWPSWDLQSSDAGTVPPSNPYVEPGGTYLPETGRAPLGIPFRTRRIHDTDASNMY